MTYQTNACFEHVDNLEGCCLFASAHAILDLLGQLDQFTNENMLQWISEAKEKGDIVADDFLQFPQAFADIIAGPSRIIYIDNVLSSDAQPGDGQAFIDYLFNPDTKFHHFVRGWFSPGHCAYDPINYGNGQGSNTASAKNAFIESKRGYQLA